MRSRECEAGDTYAVAVARHSAPEDSAPVRIAFSSPELADPADLTANPRHSRGERARAAAVVLDRPSIAIPAPAPPAPAPPAPAPPIAAPPITAPAPPVVSPPVSANGYHRVNTDLADAPTADLGPLVFDDHELSPSAQIRAESVESISVSATFDQDVVDAEVVDTPDAAISLNGVRQRAHEATDVVDAEIVDTDLFDRVITDHSPSADLGLPVIEPATIEPATTEPTSTEPTSTEPAGPLATATRPTRPTRASRRQHIRTRKRRSRAATAVWTVAIVVASVVVAVLVRSYAIQSFWIPSSSMEPTLHGCTGCQDDRVLVNKLSYTVGSISRGDVVVFHRPPGVPEQDTYLIKRVVGLSGDVISARNSVVVVNGHQLIEKYVNPACGGTSDFGPVTVPAGEVFVMGDNRCGSLDSRSFGTIKKSTVVGRAFMIVWPLDRVHWL
jgi:signal peptidase I